LLAEMKSCPAGYSTTKAYLNSAYPDSMWAPVERFLGLWTCGTNQSDKTIRSS